jgi:hypothetical protein
MKKKAILAIVICALFVGMTFVPAATSVKIKQDEMQEVNEENSEENIGSTVYYPIAKIDSQGTCKGTFNRFRRFGAVAFLLEVKLDSGCIKIGDDEYTSCTITMIFFVGWWNVADPIHGKISVGGRGFGVSVS